MVAATRSGCTDGCSSACAKGDEKPSPRSAVNQMEIATDTCDSIPRPIPTCGNCRKQPPPIRERAPGPYLRIRRTKSLVQQRRGTGAPDASNFETAGRPYAASVKAELERLPRLQLATLPTPLQEAPRLAAAIGLDRLLIKRDDNTGLAMGGNKARKLEYLVADAVRAGADTLVTLGAPQSNHCRMTAAAAKVAGLECRLVPAGQPIGGVQGNIWMGPFFRAAMTVVWDRPALELKAVGAGVAGWV